ncbi:MAG: hypothetical protein JWP97_5505, partial [Labilithrix sp.]|nr:hypothetical protein [Labilithrix sp.]
MKAANSTVFQGARAASVLVAAGSALAGLTGAILLAACGGGAPAAARSEE